MSEIGMLPVLLREIFGDRKFPREPEPMLMNEEDQVDAYAAGGISEDHLMTASHLFHAAHITSVIKGCQKVVDLGCGPATQLIAMARANPGVQFIGVELAEKMIVKAKRMIAEEGLDNIDVVEGDITDLSQFENKTVDAVITTASFHHLPSYGHLEQCFSEIDRILAPEGALYLSDFCRLKSLKSVMYFAYKYEKALPHALRLDYERSLRAAFTDEEYEKLLNSFGRKDVKFHTTKFVPFMMVIKTADKGMDTEQKVDFAARRKALSSPYRRELDALRMFMKMNGMADEPFSKQ